MTANKAIQTVIGFLYACRRDCLWNGLGSDPTLKSLILKFLYACRRDYLWNVIVAFVLAWLYSFYTPVGVTVFGTRMFRGLSGASSVVSIRLSA